MTGLWLLPAHASQMSAHADQGAPHEVCGLIFGIEADGWAQARQIVPIRNTAADPAHAYYMDERELAAALTTAERRGLALIGIYHSHPKSAPIPSPDDVRHAAYPGTAYVIIAPKTGVSEMGAWMIERGAVEALELHIAPVPPPAHARTSASTVALIVTVLMGMMLMLFVSLSLLPPAPELPR